MRNALLLLMGLGTLGPLATRAQTQLSGQVLDRQTRQPVPYASVVVPGTTLGTTSNAEGQFVLRVPQLPTKVLAFSLGYGRDSATVAQPSAALALSLAPVPIALPAAEPAGYAAELLAKAYRQLQRTRPQAQYGQAFYRQVTRNDQQPTEVQEAVWDVKTSSAGLNGSRLAQGRYASRPTLMNFTNFSTYTKMASGFCAIAAADTTDSHAVVSPDANRLYTLQYKGLTQASGRAVAEIAFASRPGIPPVTGSVYIDPATAQVLHARATRPMQTSVSKKGFDAKNDQVTVEMDFRPLAGSTFPNYVKVDASLAVSQPRKPDAAVAVASLAYFYDQRPVPTGLPYAGPNGPLSDLAAIKQKPYNADFWRDNSAVKRTPLEEEVLRAFENQKAFGTLLNK